MGSSLDEMATTGEFPVPLQPIHRAHKELKDAVVLSAAYVETVNPAAQDWKSESNALIRLLRCAESTLAAAIDGARNRHWYRECGLPPEE